MDFTQITTLISTIGFPIVAAGAMFWKVNQQDKTHKEKMDNLTQVIQTNTVALQRLSDVVEDKIN